MQTLHIAELPRHEPPAAQDGHLGLNVAAAAEKFIVGCVVVRDLGTHGP